jgi:hypothetical protein
MPRDRLPYLIPPVVALIAILPLILHGCSCGHDFDFHIVSWLEAASQFGHGTLHPHWAYIPAYNAGEPRFVFYPPLSWTIGAILGIFLPWTWTPIVYTWLALTASGFALHRLAREFVAPAAALLAAAFYMVNPYMLFTAYERTAYAELLAAAWIPLLLHAVLREKITIPRIAIPIALLWLTNAPAAVMSCYALALVVAIRLLQTRAGITKNATTLDESRLRIAATTTLGTLLGMGFAAFYILPAAYERRFVHIGMALLPGMRIQDNLLFHRSSVLLNDPFHDIVLHTVSLVAVILIAMTIAALFIAYATRESKANRPPILPLTILTLAIVLLLTPITLPLWNHLPEMAFLQFPWRFLAILAVVLGLALALTLKSLPLSLLQQTLLTMAIAAALTFSSYSVFRQVCGPKDTVASHAALFHSSHGTDPTDEYTPLTADNDALSENNPAFWLANSPTADSPTHAPPGPAPTRLTLTTSSSRFLILNLRDYPAWRIIRNDALVTTRLHRPDGLIAIPLPAGISRISITYSQLRDQTIGDIITAICIAVLLLILFRKRLRRL